MTSDNLGADVLYLIPLVIGIAMVTSALNRWPREVPGGASEAQRWMLLRLINGRLGKALAGSALADVAIGGVLRHYVLYVHWTVWLAVVMLSLGFYDVLRRGDAPSHGTLRSWVLLGVSALVATGLGVLVVSILGLIGRATAQQLMLAYPALLVSGALHWLVVGAIRDCVDVRATTGSTG